MNHKKIALYLITILFFAGICTAAKPQAQPEPNLPKVLILGDSISLGYTKDVTELLKNKAQVLRPKKSNGGRINCANSGRYITNLDNWLGDTKWDVIHFNCGLWDICYKTEKGTSARKNDKINGKIMGTSDEYKANLQQIVARLKSTGAKLIWASTTPVPEGDPGRLKGDEVKYNDIAAKIMAENGIPVNDLYSYMLPNAEKYWIKPGNVHYKNEGSKFLAVKVAAILECALGPVKMELWPNGVPGALGNKEKDIPTITVYLPTTGNANGIAVLVCPGGGYGHLAMNHEGKQIAEWLNSFGTAAFVLNYRHSGKGYAYPAPLDDSQRAMRMIRGNAALWDINPKKIGVIGFSAGGHLASTVTTLYNKVYGKANDRFDAISSRPDFSILCYPVISMTQSFTHAGSRRNLLGKEFDPKLAEIMSTEKQITPDTPPTFLLHSSTDRVVLVENSIAFHNALKDAGVETKMCTYDKGRHGYGLARNVEHAKEWPDECQKWILSITSQTKSK